MGETLDTAPIMGHNKEVIKGDHMDRFIETRGMLAKLLAKENLVIEHDNKAKTASFNTQDRVLTLPVLETTSECVYNLMCAHEVGHALATPADWNDQVPNNVPFDFVNVIEDVRIEKLIQNQYPGLRRDFALGYNELNDQDFFGIAGDDLSKKSLIDRINLHFKLGSRALVPFTDEEMTYVNAVDEADSWQKVLLVSQMICDYLKAKRDQEQDMSSSTSTEEQSSSDDGQQQSSQMNTDSDESDEDSESDDTEQSSDGDKTDPVVDEFTSETQNDFDENMEKLTNAGFQSDYAYVKAPTEFNNVIVTSSMLRQSYHDTFDKQHTFNEFQTYLNDIKSDVMFMVQQFEMKKSADAYARQQIHKTGELNVDRLYDYQLTDDIFLRQSTTPDGKNHGMVMLLDWSGSMCNITISVVKQIITLVQFCRKVQIPFKVLTFTSNNNYDRNNYKLESVGYVCPEGLSLVEVLNSTDKKHEINRSMFNLWCEAYYIERRNSYYPHSLYMEMGGTPLNNVLCFMPHIINQFKADTKTQKVSFVCVTDGESSPVYSYELRKGYGDNPDYVRPDYNYYSDIMLRDGAKVYPLGGMKDQTGNLAKWIETKVDDISVMNIYLGTLKACARYLDTQHSSLYPVADAFKKEGGATVTTPGWNTIVLLNPKNFTPAQTEIECEDGASKAKIKSALKKMLKSKSSSKKVLTTMVGSFA